MERELMSAGDGRLGVVAGSRMKLVARSESKVS